MIWDDQTFIYTIDLRCTKIFFPVAIGVVVITIAEARMISIDASGPEAALEFADASNRQKIPS